MFVLPMTAAAAASRRSTTGADRSGTYAYAGHAAVVGTPATSMLSFTARVHPCSGPATGSAGSTSVIHTCSDLTAGLPSPALGGERLVLHAPELLDGRRVVSEEALVGGEVERRRLDRQLVHALAHVLAQVEQLVGVDGVEAQLVELAQQPRRLAVGAPHWNGAADELVAARPLHAVHAQVRAADA